jgi:hypothetical protein
MSFQTVQPEFKIEIGINDNSICMIEYSGVLQRFPNESTPRNRQRVIRYLKQAIKMMEKK